MSGSSNQFPMTPTQPQQTTGGLTVAQMLADAQSQYHKLMTGQQVVSVVDSNGERIQFTPATRSDLIAYIQTLQAQIAPPTPGGCQPSYYYGWAAGVPCYGYGRPGPAGFIF